MHIQYESLQSLVFIGWNGVSKFYTENLIGFTNMNGICTLSKENVHKFQTIWRDTIRHLTSYEYKTFYLSNLWH